MNDFLMMCWEFFKAGLFAIGGGVVTLPFFNTMAEKYDWFTTRDVADMIAISEATPGPFGINMATFAGYKAYGIIGSVAGVFSLVLPSFVIIIIVSKFLDRFSENKYVKYAFFGLRPAVCGRVINAWISIARVALVHPENLAAGKLPEFFNIPAIVLFAIIFFCSYKFKKLPPAIWIGVGAICGLLFL